MWHPWRRLRDLPEVGLEWQDRDDQYGHYDFIRDCITITSGMDQAERRCTLTHELIHRERGPVPAHLADKEEEIVCDLAARRLITLEALLDGMVWCYSEHELAEHLWVDDDTLVTRLRNLTPDESDYLETELYRREVEFG